MTKAQPTPKQLMHSTQRMLADAAAHWDDFYAAIDEVLEVPISSGFGATGHSSDISDPTGTIALASGRLYWSQKLVDAQQRATEAHAHAKALLALMSARPVQAVDPGLKRLARCCEPLCEELTVADGRCRPHYDANRYATKRAGTSVSNKTVLEPVACEPRPVEPTRLPSGAITVERKEWCRTCGLSIDTAVLAEHQERCTG